MNLDGKTFRVSTGSEHGVVTADTRLELRQKGARVLGRYRGGTIVRGYLIGRIWGAEFRFRYAQREAAGGVHGGSSVCELRSATVGCGCRNTSPGPPVKVLAPMCLRRSYREGLHTSLTIAATLIGSACGSASSHRIW
jgi:hypothetical protein